MKTLDSFCHSNSFLRTKVALLTFHNIHYSHWTEKTLIILEYFQLISQCLYLHAVTNAESSKDFAIFRFILYFFKLVNPSYLMPLQIFNSLSQTILLIVFCCTMLKYILVCYIAINTYYDLNCNSLLLALWRWTFKLQSRVLCSFITSFWVNVILGCSADTFSITGIDKSVVVGISGVLIGVEYAFSFFLETQFSYVLPTRNYLASKDYKIQVATLIQKLILQILQVSFEAGSQTILWNSNIFNLLLSCFKSHYLYKTLPLYNFKSLLYQGDLLSIVLSLNLICIAQTILKSADYGGEMVRFLIISWILISVLMVKAFREVLVMRICSLMISSTGDTPKYAMHKLIAHNQLEKALKEPGKRTKKIHYSYLISAILKTKTLDIFNVKVIEYKENELFQEYLANLANKFPGNSLLTLYLAYLCLKDSPSYMKAIKIIAGFKQRTWSQNYLSSLILLYELEKTKLATSQSEKDTQLDILSYIQSQTIVEDLRNSMLQQTDLNIVICNNILDKASNIGQIFNCAQKINSLKAHIQKKISLLSQEIPDSFIEPLLLCGRYHLVLGYSIEEYQKYNALYLQKHTKYEKSFKELAFTKDNLYQENNVFMILSGEKNKSGQIAFTTHSIEHLCGKKYTSYKGLHISSLFTPTYQAFYAEALKHSFEIGEKNLLDQAQKAFICHNDGYVVETEVYFKIHPYISCGLYLDLIVRSVPSSTKQYLLVKEDGNIEGATQIIADILYLKTGSRPSPVLLNIRQISDELWRMNQAFNLIMKVRNKEKRENIMKGLSKSKSSYNVNPEDYNDALELYNLYSSSSKKIQLMNTRQALRRLNTLGQKEEKKTYYYDCSVSIFSYGDSFLKLIALERVEKDEGDQSIEDTELNEGEDNDSDSIFGSENIDSPERVDSIEIGIGHTEVREFTTRANLIASTNQGLHGTRILPFRRNQYGYSMGKREVEQVENSNSIRKRIEFESSIQVYQNAHDKLVYKVFQNAVAKDFHPKSFFTLCTMFYGVMLITLFSQIVLKIISDTTMNDLSIKKNLLMYSQLRTYKVLLIDVNARGGINNIVAGSVDKGQTNGGLTAVFNNLQNHVLELKSYNQEIIDGMVSLDDEIQRDIYAQDIRVYGSYVESSNSSYRVVTNFEVIDEMIDAIRALLAIKLTSNMSDTVYNYEIIPGFEFLVRNSLGDFLYKSQEITTLFTELVNSEKAYLRDTIIICLVITPLLLIGIILTMTVIIIKQYNNEKSNMFAFIQLNPELIKLILTRLKQFKKNLEDQDYSSRSGTLEAFPTGILPESTFHKRFDADKINNSETRLRYVKYVIRVTLYILILIGIMMWNYISAQLSANVIYRRQNQLEFANRLSETVSISNSAQAELFSSNNTIPVKHMSPSELIETALEEITIMQSQVPEVFMEENHNYNPQIEAMIFTNTLCSQYDFDDPLYDYFCEALVNSGQKINFISLIALYRSLLQGRIPDYDACDISNMTELLTCGYSNSDFFLPAFALVAAEAQLMGNLISNSIETDISDANHERKLFLSAFSFSLVVVGFLLWIQILKKLRNSHNDFKKVLQVFPANLILSSFLLKSFLMQHSKEIQNIRTTQRLNE